MQRKKAGIAIFVSGSHLRDFSTGSFAATPVSILTPVDAMATTTTTPKGAVLFFQRPHFLSFCDYG